MGKYSWMGFYGVDATVTTITEYNNQNSRAYKSEGKSLIHTAVSQIKSAGPIEGAILLSRGGPWGTLAGFLLGTANTLWSFLGSESRENVYSAAQNMFDDIYDFIDNLNVGKAVSGTIDSIKQIFNGGVKYE